MGNSINVICNYVGNDTVLVNAKHKEILSKVFADVTYELTAEELALVNQDMFTNQVIYRMLDMSKGPEFLPKLSQEEFDKLGKKLSFILNLDWNPSVIPAGRMRFRSFKSIDDFTLISDHKCKGSFEGYYHNVIVDGLTVKVKDDDVTVKYGELEK